MILVILEGPDGAGKTTLANHLVDELGAARIHQGPFKDGDIAKIVRKKVKKATKKHDDTDVLVFDRLIHGELVYGPVLRGESRVDEPGVRAVMGELRATYDTVLTILCQPRFNVVFYNWLQSPDDELPDSEQLRVIDTMYDNMGQDGWFDLTYNYEFDDVDALVERIARAAS